MNSAYTFPSRVRNLSRGWFDSYVEPYRNDDMMTGEPGPRGEFHRDNMKDAKQHVLDGVYTTMANELVNLAGGHRNFRNKPEPTGSFSRPLNMDGNTGYGKNSNLQGKGGSFRTSEGSAYGQKLLQRRGEQMEQMYDAQKGIPGVKKEPLKLDPNTTKVVAIELFLSHIMNTTLSQDWSDIKLEELRKLYNGIYDVGFDLTMEDLTRMNDILQNIIQNVEILFARSSDLSEELTQVVSGEEGYRLSDPNMRAIASMGDRDFGEYEDLLSRWGVIYKVYNLVRAFIYSFDLQKKDRKTYMKVEYLNISKAKNQSTLGEPMRVRAEKYHEERLSKLKKGEYLEPHKEKYTSQERTQRIREGTEDFDEAERRQFQRTYDQMYKESDQQSRGLEYPRDRITRYFDDQPSSSSSSEDGRQRFVRFEEPVSELLDAQMPRFSGRPSEMEAAEAAREIADEETEAAGGEWFGE
tara:strand:- start:1388 stop:2785 length:1398 start_codon:yes stop_codon:yes gene_type:complete